MVAVNRTNPVNGNLPLTGLIRSTAFHDHPNTEQVNGLPFPFPTPLQNWWVCFSPLCPTPPSFLYMHKKSAWCRACGGCVVCVVRPLRAPGPPGPSWGFRDTAGPVPPPGCHWHCPVKRGRREKGPAFRSLRDQLSGVREPLVAYVLAWLSRLGRQKGPHGVPHAPQ